jgi:hypothetical protein
VREKEEKWKKSASEGGNAIAGVDDGRRRRRGEGGRAVVVGRRDGRRRWSCLPRGCGSIKGWEKISFLVRVFGLVYTGPGQRIREKDLGVPEKQLDGGILNHAFPQPPHPIPPVMAQVTEENPVPAKPRSLLRSVMLIASCTAAMIVNVRPSPVCLHCRQLSRNQPKGCNEHVRGHCSSLRREGPSNLH